MIINLKFRVFFLLGFEYRITLVNFANLTHMGEQITNELYILSSQVSQCFYVKMKGIQIGLES
jgi:hypothetical protein